MKSDKIFLTGFCCWILMFFSSCHKDNEKRITPNFTSDTQQVLEGQAVNFSDISEGQPSRWKWTFEGGEPATSELSDPVIVYKKAGTYSVTLELSNAFSSMSVKKETYITVGYNEVAANFKASDSVIVQDKTISFTDLSTGNPTTWKWEFTPATGTPIVSTEQNPTVKFSIPGIYSVKLTASNAQYSNVITKVNYITVMDYSSISADFLAVQTATYAGTTIAFQDKTLGVAESWSWEFEGGTPALSTEKNPSVTYANPGRYKVKLIASNPVKSSTLEKTGYILVIPSANLLAFLPFNTGAQDVGPAKLVPAVTGTLSYADNDRKTITGNAATFSGVNGVTLPTATYFNLGVENYSVSCWLKTSSTARMMIWQESGKNGTGDSQSWLRIGDNATTQYMRFNTEASTGSNIVNLAAEGKVSDGTWHHVVCVREGLNMRVYIDGVKTKEATTAAIRNVSGNQNFKIGFQEAVSSYSNYFTGQLDDIIVYKRALTDAQVLELFNL